MLNRIQKHILRVMIESGCDSGRWLSTLEIAEECQLSWKGAYLNLIKLKKLKYVKSRKEGKERIYSIEGTEIRAVPKIKWTLRFKNE